jgi:hypothetical protein
VFGTFLQVSRRNNQMVNLRLHRFQSLRTPKR